MSATNRRAQNYRSPEAVRDQSSLVQAQLKTKDMKVNFLKRLEQSAVTMTQTSIENLDIRGVEIGNRKNINRSQAIN
jgi:hypothetical protein